MKDEVNNMPAKGSHNESLRRDAITKDGKTKRVFISQDTASANYEKNKVEQITVRLPKGSRQILQDYIDNSGKYKSVNAMIKSLLEAEIGQTLD